MSNHSEAADSDNLSLCIHCNATFKSKTSLDDHTIREHPEVHECPCCTYKTTVKGSFDRHMLKHPETVSVSSKIHACAHCPYKTVMKANLDRHMSKHPESAVNYNLSICVHCNATYKSKKNLDDHIIRKHPDCIESISSKIHECTHCTYKTTVKGHLTEHMVQHTETADIYKLRCIHCDETFKRRAGLDEHIIKKHPHLIATITSKIHECTYCAYQTVLKPHFARHMLKHPETADNYKLKICVHCNATFKSKASLDNHTVREHPDFVASVSNKLHECAHCTYKTTLKSNFSKHMRKHSKAVSSVCTCIHCNAVFKRKRSLDDHIVRKHPDFIAFVSSKIHECTHCSYKTAMKANLNHHMLKHPETADSYRYIACVHCNATYKTKKSLDDHTIRKHPDSITCITSKVHKCAYCTYKTTVKGHFTEHMLKHSETTDSHKLSKCIHCNAIYKHKIGLDDHILRQHPELIASVSSKMHECTHCAFKTVLKANLALHMLEHHETADRCKFSTCVHCNTTFIHKQALSDHILTKHPESIGSVSSQIYECTLCAFRTVSKPDLDRHMVKHPETEDKHPEMVDRCTFRTCVQCNATFKSRQGLNDHTLKKHPESIGSISSKIYECPQCTFKTVMKSYLTRHMLKHPETADRCKFSACVHCNATFKSKPSLVDHTLRKHPDSVESNSIRIYECTHCAYKTCLKRSFTKHILKHP
nr:unnamed protein product [Callosobruchus analis]